MEKREEILAQARLFVRDQLGSDTTGHDWWHALRVTNLARHLASSVQADVYVCELAALLHDVADYKIAGDEATGLRRVSDWLEDRQVADEVSKLVLEIIASLSFAGGNQPPMRTLEGQVVQDADRLDAIGAIGIARAFAFGGSRGRALYDPEQSPSTYASKEAYHQSNSSTINHFYEKLLWLKDRMNTAPARQLAEERHRYLETFLEEFLEEWQGHR
jgi:uncharacterized protein